MNKDLIDDRYGRFYELPLELARLGHRVVGICLSYRKRSEGHLTEIKVENGNIDWHSVNFSPAKPLGIIKYIKAINNILSDYKPNLVLSCSDALHLIIGKKVAKKWRIPYVVDLYDNFESYGLTRIPGIMYSFRDAVNEADGVVVVSNPLKKYVKDHYKTKGDICLITNGLPYDLFKPMDPRECRTRLQLPIHGAFIGTAGALQKSRGVETIFKAYNSLVSDIPNLHLLLAGPLGVGVNLPAGENIHYLGSLDYQLMPTFFNSLDVGIISNVDSLFGRYCFPQKAFEMIACGIPIVAADVGVMSDMLKDNPDNLFAPGNSSGLAEAIKYQIKNQTNMVGDLSTWKELGKDLEVFLKKSVKTM